MSSTPSSPQSAGGEGRSDDFLAGGGQTGALIGARDWSATPLGPLDAWPDSLRTMLAFLLRSPVPIVMLWGEEGVMLYNDAYSAFAGGRHPDLLGTNVREGWPEVADFNDNVMRVGLAGGTLSYRDQELTLHRHGEPERVWMDLDYSPVPGDDGRPAGVLAVVIETTERRRIEKERDRALRLLESFSEAVPGVVYAKDRQGRLLVANRGTAELVGKPLPAIIGRTDAEILDDRAEADAVMATDERVMASGEAVQVEEVVSFPDGRRAVWLSTKSPLRDEGGAVVGLVGSSVDITARREVEWALEDSEARLRLATDAAEVGFWDVDLVADELIWPPVVKAMFGISPREPVSMADFYAGLHPDDRDATGAAFAAAADPVERALYDVEYRTVGREDGVVRWVAAKGRGVFDGERCVRVIGTAIDITARKRDELALRELNERLEQRVAEVVAEREQAEEALRQAQKMEAVGQLTGGIAHDFNNLLTVVTGNIDMAGRALEAAGAVDPRVRRAMDSAMKGAERAAALTQRLLAFSRRQPLAPRPLDADRLVAGMSDMLNRALGEIVRLEIVTSPGLWRVEADPNQLEAAILNLAVNARDAMPRGGTLTIETANARLDDGYSAAHAEVAPGQYVVIAVTDTGSGMDRDTLARVFEPFFTTKEVGKGTGLGLSQVYGFTKQSGGHVKIYSEADEGTTVKIYLPRLLSEEDAEPSGTVTGGLEMSRERETVLAVEDDDDVRAYTVECLRELGYRVLEAHDGPSAIRLMERQEQPLDLLFTDVVMPGMSGRELADELRRRQPDLKVLYTSGYTRNAIMHGGRLDGGVEMIAKPFTFEALGRKVRDMLEAGSTRRVLLVEDEPTVRAFAAEALDAAGFTVDGAATAAEALMKIRAAQGRYDAVILEMALPDKQGDALAGEIRALHADMPLLIASDGQADAVRARFQADRCVRVLPKPYSGTILVEALRDLGIRCGGG